ncbi:MAG: hypothetical protein JSS71_01690, partial [Armatimonadetes bacterium]|nr:hypothetical protein [Armatimonadota bacterium]
MNDTPVDKDLLVGHHTNTSLDATIGDIVLVPATHNEPKVKTPIPGIFSSPWQIMFGIGFVFVNILLLSIAMLVWNGIGIWGNNQPVGWCFDFINVVWWICFGHSGTLISAVLLRLRQKWRYSINRFAE